MADIGCCAEVLQHQTTDDGRSYIVTLGQQRFRVLNITRETPFRSAMVSWIEDDHIDDPDSLNTLSQTVSSCPQRRGQPHRQIAGSGRDLADDLPDLPRSCPSGSVPISTTEPPGNNRRCWNSPTPSERLQRQFDMLDNTRRQLAARTVLKDTLSNARRLKDD